MRCGEASNSEEDKVFQEKGGGLFYSAASRTCNKRKKRRKKKDNVRMIDAICSLYYLVRVSRVKSDGLVFRLHALTTIFMLAFSIIISSKQAVGNPIECVHTRDIPVEAFNAYCWIHSTYFVTGAMLGVAGANVAFPGVAPSGGNLQSHRYHQGGNTDGGGVVGNDQDGRRTLHEPSTRKRVKYYQWVAFVLILQR